jgi:hypothetical protein
VELLLLSSGAVFLVLGLDLPPPVGRTVETAGQVSGLIVTSRGLTFSVGQMEFTSSGPGWRKLRSNLRDGLSVRVVGWTGFLGGNDGPAGVVELESDVGRIVSRNQSLRVFWFFSLELSAIGLTVIGIGIHALLQPRSMAERLRELEPKQPTLPASTRRRHHKRGAKLSIAGLLLVYSPLFYAVLGSLSGLVGFFFGSLSLLGAYFVFLGSHRLLFGRPMMRHDSTSRRIVFGLLVAFFLVATFLALTGILASSFV